MACPRLFALGLICATSCNLLVNGSESASDLPSPREGWQIELIAEAPEISHPSVVCTAPDGRIFVAEDPMDIRTPRADVAEGRIICLHPDGLRTVFADKLYAVFGMQYLDGKLYVLHNPKFSVFRDDHGVGKDGRDLIESTNPNPWAQDWNDHVPANFRLAMDGYFYISTGDKGFYQCKGTDGRVINLRTGGIVRMRPDGTELEVYSSGVRNILDVAINSEDELFTYDNTDERQWMSRVTHMVDGGEYGYPFDFIPQRPYTLWMMADYGGGAATGAFAYTQDALPASYQDNLFLADFGKRQVLRLEVERQGATYAAKRRTDLFSNVPDDFRPVGICPTADGSGILICDWRHVDNKENVVVGRLWRLTHDGATHSAPKPAWWLSAAQGEPCVATGSELIEALGHPSADVRMVAQRRLIDRGPKVSHLVASLLRNENAPAAARMHAIWILDATRDQNDSQAAILKAIGSPEDAVSLQAIRQVGARRVKDGRAKLANLLRSPNGSIRFAAATALGRIGEASSIPAILGSLEDPDLFALYSKFLALRRIGLSDSSAWPMIVNGLKDANPKVVEGVQLAIREVRNERLVDALFRLHDDSAAVEVRSWIAGHLASIAKTTPEWKGEWWSYHPVVTQPPAKTVSWSSTERILDRLRSDVNHTQAPVRIAAMRALGEIGDLASAAPVRKAIERADSTDEERIAAVGAIAKLKDGESAAAVASIVANPRTSRELLLAAVQAAKSLRSTKASWPLLSQLEQTSDVELMVKICDALGEFGGDEAVDGLVNVAKSQSGEAMEAATRALVRIETEEAAYMVGELFHTGSSPLKAALMEAIGQRPRRELLPLAREAFRVPELRSSASLAMVKVPDAPASSIYIDLLNDDDAFLRDGARKAIESLRDQTLPIVEERLGTLPDGVIAELQRIFRDFEPAKASPLFSREVKQISLHEFESFALEHVGNALRGKTLFADERGLGCVKCHANSHVSPSLETLGPDLTTVGAQFPRKTLIEHVLYPNRSVREGYQTLRVVTESGAMVSGLFRGEDSQVLRLIDQNKKIIELRKDEIEEVLHSNQSLMPENLQAKLSLVDFADLMAFLESCRRPPAPEKDNVAPPGFESLFNGNDLAGWNAGPEVAKHWFVRDGVLCHDGIDQDLWTQDSFGDFVLRVDWRFPNPPTWEDFPLIGADGYEVLNDAGKPVTKRVLDAGDSGVFLRGFRKAQANLFCYPVGSGEVWEYRTDPKVSDEVRRAVTPRKQADRPVGEWNTMVITMRGDRLTVQLNGEEVITRAPLPGVPMNGPIGLQHEHGKLEFKNLFIQRLEEPK